MALFRVNLKTLCKLNSFREFNVSLLNLSQSLYTSVPNCEWNVYHRCLPSPVYHKFRRKVYYPEKYTVEPLRNDNLAGRDPNTGRVVTARVGGGIKYKYHWVDNKRIGPTKENEFLVEKVLQIMICGCHTAHIALVGGDTHLRYIIATINMKPGDLIRTSQFIPPEPYLVNEGDAFPLGGLPVGTLVHNLEKLPGQGGILLHAAGCFGTIMRKINKRVIVKLPSKLEVSFAQECMATVGQISNAEHASIPIGSPNKNRQLGNRPRSGLWHRKDGRFGRKIKPPPPVLIMKPQEEPISENIRIKIPSIKIKYPEGYV